MVPIDFSALSFRIRETNNGDEIFDPVRKRWIILTPEEWVRQNFIAYLNEGCSIPLSLLGIEKRIKVGDLNRRFDIIVYSRGGKPWMVVECKALHVPLSHHTISQVLAYVSAINCPYFFITNGKQTFGWQVINGNVSLLESMPLFA